MGRAIAGLFTCPDKGPVNRSYHSTDIHMNCDTWRAGEAQAGLDLGAITRKEKACAHFYVLFFNGI